MNYKRRILLALLVYFLPAAVQASAIQSLKSFIKDTQTMSAVFTQKILDKNAQIIQQSTGTMLLERPNKFRWTYEEPYPQLIIGDGSKVWFYDQDLNQVTVRELDAAIGNSPAALLAGHSSIENNFELVETGLNERLEWLEATPKTDDNIFEAIQLGFTPEGALDMMVLRDNFGQTTLFSFSDIQLNPKFATDLFTFTPPDGVDIISE